MKRQKSEPVFKAYVMNQMSLMPQSYEEKIPAGHLVRLVNEAIEALDLEVLLAQYEGGGTSSYHPKMMLKVLVYAYCKKIYTSRKIAEALEENIHFMWLSGEQTPDFRTLNDFRGRRMKEVIEDVFGAVVEQIATPKSSASTSFALTTSSMIPRPISSSVRTNSVCTISTPGNTRRPTVMKASAVITSAGPARTVRLYPGKRQPPHPSQHETD